MSFDRDESMVFHGQKLDTEALKEARESGVGGTPMDDARTAKLRATLFSDVAAENPHLFVANTSTRKN